MPLSITEDEIDDLIYLARANEGTELSEFLASLATRENVTPAEILAAAQDQGKNTCLHMASANGHIDIVKSLLSAFGASTDSTTATASPSNPSKQSFLDAANEHGNTALHWAAMNGKLAVVKLLMENGASPAIANTKNYIPLDLAGLSERTDVVDFFLSRNKEQDEDVPAVGGLSLEEGKEAGEGEEEEEILRMSAGDVDGGGGSSS